MSSFTGHGRSSPLSRRRFLTGAGLFRKMASRNIKLSRLGMDGNPLLDNYIRFTMGTHDEVQVAVSALQEELTA